MSAPNSCVHLELYGTPVSAEPTEIELDRGTILELLGRANWQRPAEQTQVILDGHLVPAEMWRRVRPHAGSRLVIVGRPADPGTLSAITAFFVAAGQAAAGVATFGVIGGVNAAGLAALPGAIGIAASAGALVGSAVGTAALSFGFSALAGALVDAPRQDMMDSGGPANPTFNGTGNQARPNAPYPYVAGQFRFQPPIGAFPFSVIQGNEQVLYALFIVGKGEHSFSTTDIMIGDIPIAQFDRARVAIRQGAAGDPSLSIFTNRVFQTALNSIFDPLEFNHPTLRSPWVQFPVQGEGHKKLGVDFNFPTGLGVSRAGGLRNYFFGVQIEFRANGGSWFDAIQQFDFGPVGGAGNTSVTAFQGLSIVQFNAALARPFQVGFTWSTGGGDQTVYDVRIRRVEIISPNVLPGGSETLSTFGTFVWFALKGFNFLIPPLEESGVATIELELPLDEQFNGALNNFSVEVRRKVRIYNPGDAGGTDVDGWTTLKYVSSNPAAIIRDVLQGVNSRVPEPDSRLDIAALTSYYTYCANYNDGGSGPLRFDFVFEDRGSAFETCQTIAAACRARFGQNGRGLFTVVFDGPKSGQGINLINSANCRGFRMQLDYAREVHAIRAQFVDATSGYDPNAEMEVYEDGYSADGAGGTLIAEEDTFETVVFPGTAYRSLVYALARYRLAVPRLRPRAFEVDMDLEQLGFSVGELVELSHPAGLFGSADGLIKSVSSVVYRDFFDRTQPPWADNTRDVHDATIEYANLDVLPTRGDGSAKLVTTLTTIARFAQQLGATQDWSDCRFDVAALVGTLSSLSAFDGIRVRLLGPTLSDYKEWQFGTDLGINATTFTTVGETLASAPAASAGSFNPAQVVRWEIHANVVGGAVGRIFRFNDFRITRLDGKIVEVEADQGLEFKTSFTYGIVYRRVDTVGVANVVEFKTLRSLATFGITSDRLNRFAYLQTPITASTVEPLAGYLYTFGRSDSARIRCIVKDKVAGPDLTARVILVDEAPGLHAVTGTLPNFVPGTSVPVPLRQVGPGQPFLRQVVSDERALVIAGDGTLKPRILIHVVPSTVRGRPPADFFTGRYRRTGPTSALHAIPIPRVDGSAGEIIIEDVDEGGTYEITIQGVTAQGLASEPLVFTHTVIGKSTRPPDVLDFRLEGTLLQWRVAERPKDLAGFKILRAAIGSQISQARWITEPMLVTAPPFDTSRLDPADSQLFILAVDTAGNESLNPAIITGFIGSVPIQNVVNTIDVDAAGFPIVDQVQSVLGDFERLIPRETPNTTLAVVYGPEDVQDILSPLQGDTQTTLDVEMTTVFAGLRALKLTDLDASGSLYTITYSQDINRTKCKLRSRIRGAKASVTWTVRYRLIDFADANKWSRWDVTGLGTQSYVNAQVDLSTAPTATGSSGAADLTRFRYLEIKIENSSPANNDVVLQDSLEWVGGAINGVEVDAGDLKTMAQSDQFWNLNPAAQFWNASGTAAFWGTVIYLDGIYEFTATVGASDVPSDLRLEFSDPGVPYTVWYKNAGVFVPFPGVLKDVAVGTYSFQIRLAGGFVRGIIDQLAVVLDVADERETINDFSVASTGTVRLPITKTYREIRDVIPVVQGSTPGVFVLLDKDETLGPSVQVVNLSGTRITALVDATIVGVKG